MNILMEDQAKILAISFTFYLLLWKNIVKYSKIEFKCINIY